MAYTPINLYGQGSQGMGGDPLGALIGEEMTGTQLGQQGFQNFLSQQGMQQQERLAQQELAGQREGRMFQMAGDVFAADEAEKARQFAARESQLDRQARQAENDEMRRFQMGMWQKEQALQLELSKIDAEIEDAVANELATQIPALRARRDALSKERNENATKLAAAQALQGQSKEGVAAVLGNMRQQMTTQMNAQEQAISLADNFRKTLVADFMDSSAESSKQALDALAVRQSVETASLEDWALLKGLDRENTLAAARQLRGLEFLNLAPGASWLDGLDPKATASAAFVRGEVDAETQNNLVNKRIEDMMVKQAGAMQLRGFDENALREAIRMSLGDEQAGDRAVFAERLRASGMDPNTFKVLSAGAAQMFDTGGELQKDWTQRAAAESQRKGGQLSLVGLALEGERKMMNLTARKLTRLSNFTDVADMSALKDAIAALDAIQQTGEISALTRSAFGRAMPSESGGSLSRLESLIAQGRGAARDIGDLAVKQGDIAQREADISADQELLPLFAQLAGRGRRSKALGGIRSRMP